MKNYESITNYIVKQKRLFINVIFPVLLFSLFIALTLSSSLKLSDTTDEKFHLTRGVLLLESGDLRINQHHPYLFNLIGALPTLFNENIVVPSSDQDIWENANKDALSFQMVEINGGRVNFTQDILFPSRILMTLIIATFGLITYIVLLRLFNPIVAMLFTALLMLDPNVMAHSGLMTTDAPAIFTIIWPFLYLYWLIREKKLIGVRECLIISLLIFLALLSKYTSLIAMIPIFVLLPIYTYRTEATTNRFNLIFKSIRASALIALTVLILMTAAYKFQFGTLDDMTYGNESVRIANLHGLEKASTGNQTAHETLKWIFYNLPLPFPQYVNGFYENVFKHDLFGHKSFFLGEFGDQGWLAYFPVSFLIKVPLGTISLLFLTISMLAVQYRNIFRQPLHNWVLLVPFLLITALSLKSSLNLGIRHILPLFPFIYLFIANGLGLRVYVKKNFLLLVMVIGILILNLNSVLNRHPHYIGYFNQSVVDMNDGYKYLRDSSYDWEQNEFYALRYIANNPEMDITRDITMSSLQNHEYLLFRVKFIFIDESQMTPEKRYILDGLEDGTITLHDQISHTHMVFRLRSER